MIIGIILFVLNGMLCLFSLNLSFNEKKRKYLVHSIIFFLIAMISIYIYMKEYLFEAFVTFFILGGLASAMDNDFLPKIFKNKNSLLTNFAIVSLIFSSVLFLIYH